MIDSKVDMRHPVLIGTIKLEHSLTDAGERERAHPHGTGMAGAMAAHGAMLGVAPNAELSVIVAFSGVAESYASGDTFRILKALDWVAGEGIRVVNMSFSGPRDPLLEKSYKKLHERGVVLVAAAGNGGPNSAPAYPGADPNVIAVTAVDSRKSLFAGANRGKYIYVAAPGVDVFAPAPDGTYQLTTGTSVASAQTSGVVALMLEINPKLSPSGVRSLLRRTATRLDSNGTPSIGVVNALEAVKEVLKMRESSHAF
jgi:subtilisin family serine protease